MNSEVTRLLRQIPSGEPEAVNRLIGLIYDDLHRLADHHIRNERVGHTLQPTALVHEAYLRLVEFKEATWKDRAHFIAVASTIMRRILVDHARRRLAAKRGSGKRADLDEARDVGQLSHAQSAELLALDEALEKLAKLSPRQCQILEMRFFGGLSMEEIAEACNLSTRTVKRDLTAARIFLHDAMGQP